MDIIHSSSLFTPCHHHHHLHHYHRNLVKMSVKVYIHFEVSGFPEKTSKIAIPKSWTTKTVQDVMGLFTKAYNEKHPGTLIDVEAMHLEAEGGTKIYSNDIVETVLSDHSDYHMKPGAYVRSAVGAMSSSEGDGIAADGQPKLRCKNYGCNKYYVESENDDNACHHHTAPPIFHDTMKCWSCCRDRKAYDFETFQLIGGCSTGRHSEISPTIALAKSPNAPNEIAGGSSSDHLGLPQPPALKSIDAYNAANPDAASAASSAVKTLARKSTRLEDGTARCQRKGCQQTFMIESNNATACTYHKGQAIFHDAIKFWSCCPGKKCYDFDEFLAVPGCTVGYHDDGVIDLLES